jgi:hypothetical protein
MDHQFHSESLVDNVFLFDDPEEIECVVWQYVAGHSEMGIQLFDNNKGLTYFLDFTMVHYFSGPLKWKSANFQLQPWSESRLLMRELGQLPTLENAPDEIQKMMIGMHFKLYTVSATRPKIEIKILSARGHLRETK